MLKKLLLQGKTLMGIHVGIISRIQNDKYHVVAIESEYDGINEGDVFDLADTYCRDVVTLKKTMTYDDVAEITEMLKHPVYLTTQLRAYIGTPLIIDDQVWGTLNFSSRHPKQPSFSATDYELIESLAEKVARNLTSRRRLMSIG
jgi:GAF domain-containing protein